MTPAEIQAHNRAVHLVLDIVATSAAKIKATGKRPLAEGFAVAALAELATAGRALLISADPKEPSHDHR